MCAISEELNPPICHERMANRCCRISTADVNEERWSKSRTVHRFIPLPSARPGDRDLMAVFAAWTMKRDPVFASLHAHIVKLAHLNL